MLEDQYSSTSHDPSERPRAGFTVETVYRDALEQIRKLHHAGALPEKYYNDLLDTTDPNDVLPYGNDLQETKNGGGRMMKSAKSALARISRYTEAIDMIAQSSPQAYGLNIIGLLWGSFKFLLVIANDVSETHEVIIQTLDKVRTALPNIATLIDIYGDSKLHLLHRPLVDIYAAIISFGVTTAEHSAKSKHPLKTLAHSTWNSLQTDFELSIAKLEAAGRRVEQAASVEHMYATDIIRRDQSLEMRKQENFRREVRRRLRQPSIDDGSNPTIPLINSAPLGLLSQHFTGRSGELAWLKAAICRTRPDNKPGRCAVLGMPGLGKTQIALKLASDCYDRQKARMVFWISAANPQRFIQSYAKILQLVDHNDRDDSDQRAQLTATQQWLEQGLRQSSQSHGTAGTAESASVTLSWLLICDSINEETVPLLREYLPRYNDSGFIVLTARHKDVAKALIYPEDAKEQILNMDLPDKEEAVALLRLELEGLSTSETSKAEELVQNLGRLPFAISQAASFANQSMKDLDYILYLCQNERRLQMLDWDNRLAIYEQQSVVAIFDFRLRDLNQMFPVVGILLSMLSLMDPENIPLGIWVEENSPVDPTRRYWAMRNTYGSNESADHSDSEAAAQQKSQDSPENGKPAKRRVARQLVGRIRATLDRRKLQAKSQMTDEETNILVETSETAVTRMTNSTDARAKNVFATDWNRQINDLMNDPVEFPLAVQRLTNLDLLNFLDDGKALRMHDLVQLMIRHSMEQNCMQYVCFNTATWIVQRSLFRAGNPRAPQSFPSYGRLLPHLESLLKYHESLDTCNHNLVHAARMMSTYLRFRGQPEESIDILLKIIPLQEKYHGPNDLDLIRNLTELAATYNYQGEYDLALPLVSRATAVRKQILGVQHPHYLNALVSMATIKRGEGQYEEAEAHLREALRGFETDPDDPDFRRSLAVKNDIGLLYAAQHRYEEAIEIYQKTLGDVEQSLSPEDHTSITVMANLADALHKVGRQPDAQLIFERVISIMEKTWGLEHPATYEAMKDLGRVYEFLHEWDKAEQLYIRVLDVQRRRWGEDAYGSLDAMSKLAHTYSYQGRYEKAIEQQERVIDKYRGLLGPEDETTLRAIYSLGMYYMGAHKLGEAGAIFEDVLAAQKQHLRENHMDTFLSIQAFGELRYKQDRMQEAYDLFDRALAGLESFPDSRELALYSVQRKLADICHAFDQEERAEKLYKAALAGTEKTFGWPITQTVYVLRQLGIFYLDRKRWAEAEPLERRAAEGREAVNGPNHEYTDSALCGWAKALEGLERYKEAEQVRRRVLRIRLEKKDEFDMITAAKSFLANNLILQGDEDGEGLRLSYEILEDEEGEYGIRDERTKKSRFQLYWYLMSKQKLFLDDLEMCTLVLEDITEDLGADHWLVKISLQIVLGMLFIMSTKFEEEDRGKELKALKQRYSAVGIEIYEHREDGRPIVSYGSSGPSSSNSDDNVLETDKASWSNGDDDDVFHDAEMSITSA